MSAASSPLHIRDALIGERAAIRALTLAAYEELASVMAPSAWAALRQALTTTLDGDVVGQRIVAEQNGAIVGSVLLCPPTENAYGGALSRLAWPEVRLLAVSPAQRGQGIGQALMDECVRRARALGAAMIGLHTSDSLRAAVHMYERMGFERAPADDFQPPGAELVKAFRLRIDRGDQGDTAMTDQTLQFGERMKERLRDDLIIWLTTIGKDGTPQPSPVWFLWEGDSMLIYSRPNTPKLRNIERHGAVALNFNTNSDGGDVVVFTGTARLDPQAPPSDQVAAYQAKYTTGIANIGLKPATFALAYSAALRVTITRVRG